MRRSAVSIPSNIAEGHSQGTRAYARHLVISVGSHSELSTQADISFRLKFIVSDEREQLADLMGEVGRLTQGLLNAIQSRPDPRSPIPDPRLPNLPPRPTLGHLAFKTGATAREGIRQRASRHRTKQVGVVRTGDTLRYRGCFLVVRVRDRRFIGEVQSCAFAHPERAYTQRAVGN